MKTILKEEKNFLVTYFEGRLDTAAASDTEKAVQPLADCTSHDIILDCSKLEYISSSGLRIFLSILKNAKAKGSHVFIRNINENIQKIFKMTGFYNLFEFKD
ncbi:MAG: STAS domain-containing protein [Prevotella sp.]|nr:STAS domain-containing protein [Prevotella sp.]